MSFGKIDCFADIIFCVPHVRFGASLQDISTFLSTNGDPSISNLKSWITKQISTVPSSSHREFFRENINPVWDRVSGTARSLKNPCGKTARWRTTALTSRDQPRKISVETFGTKFLLKIDGENRTVLDSIELVSGAPPLVLGTQYNMCMARREFWMEDVVRDPPVGGDSSLAFDSRHPVPSTFVLLFLCSPLPPSLPPPLGSTISQN